MGLLEGIPNVQILKRVHDNAKRHSVKKKYKKTFFSTPEVSLGIFFRCDLKDHIASFLGKKDKEHLCIECMHSKSLNLFLNLMYVLKKIKPHKVFSFSRWITK